jgi:hypothetical protein
MIVPGDQAFGPRSFLLPLLCLTVPVPAHADKRVALIIGSGAYLSGVPP